MVVNLRFTDERKQAIYEAMMSSKSAAEFGKLLEDALKVLQPQDAPQRVSDKRFRRGKAEFRSC